MSDVSRSLLDDLDILAKQDAEPAARQKSVEHLQKTIERLQRVSKYRLTRQDAEDVCMDVMEAFYRKLLEDYALTGALPFSSDEKACACLKRMIRNKTVDLFRTQKKQAYIPVEDEKSAKNEPTLLLDTQEALEFDLRKLPHHTLWPDDRTSGPQQLVQWLMACCIWPFELRMLSLFWGPLIDEVAAVQGEKGTTNSLRVHLEEQLALFLEQTTHHRLALQRLKTSPPTPVELENYHRREPDPMYQQAKNRLHQQHKRARAGLQQYLEQLRAVVQAESGLSRPLLAAEPVAHSPQQRRMGASAAALVKAHALQEDDVEQLLRLSELLRTRKSGIRP
ncbi:MAG: hypothetical protein ACKO6N_10380 [Myxococcota bacterium]